MTLVYDASGFTDEEREKLKDNKSPADTLKRGMGSGSDIDLLFAALAAASGFEARVVNSARRDDIFFDKNFASSYFISTYHVAVRVGNEWRFFDPGSMPGHEQGGLAPDGAITATVQEHAAGQSAAESRRIFRSLSRPDFMKVIESWVARGATGARVLKVEPKDNTGDASFALRVEFTAPAYGQLMQERLLIFKPVIVSRRESLFLTEARRKHPVVLEAYAYTETVRVQLPAGFDVDELPDALKLDTSFGTYSTTYDVKDGHLVFTRALVQRSTTVPVEDYQKVRSFYERIRAAEQSPVVLAKK